MADFPDSTLLSILHQALSRRSLMREMAAGGMLAAVPVAVAANHVVSDDGYLGTLRARLGFAADRFMIYGTGGLAVGDTGSKWVDDGGASQFELSAGSQWGWVAGGGIEYAATDSISVKAEYLYYDLGTEKLHYSGGPPAWCTPVGEGCDFELKSTGSIVRLGVNFHF